MLKILLIFYNYFSTKIENIIFRRTIVRKNTLTQKGFEIIKLDKKLNINLSNKKEVSKNKYFKKYILKKEDLEEILKNLFAKNNLKEILEKKLGFKYNVNFVLAYKTYNIKKEDQKNGWYANHWHKDKAYSKNIIKLIIPLQKINSGDGGIQIYDKINSRTNLDEINKRNIFVFKGTEKDLLIINPNECFHKAGNPKFKPRSQIMLQLNPSFNWTKDKNLYEKQFYLEPKFPLLKSIISRTEKLQWKN